MATEITKSLDASGVLSRDTDKPYSAAVYNICPHYVHYKCINDYLLVCANNDRNNRKIIGLTFKMFQCPLCKSLSNSVFPAENAYQLIPGHNNSNSFASISLEKKKRP
jgi:hypothetical protein